MRETIGNKKKLGCIHKAKRHSKQAKMKKIHLSWRFLQTMTREANKLCIDNDDNRLEYAVKLSQTIEQFYTMTGDCTLRSNTQSPSNLSANFLIDDFIYIFFVFF
jgi:hypothetical protein